ncbi:MAG: 5-formyltetrahydrofolate cyclo-ligase [Mariprofundaceae bacterium]
MNQKQVLRQIAISARQQWPAHHRHGASKTIQQQFIQRFASRHKTWFIYRATSCEVGTQLLIQHPGVNVFAPVTLSEEDMRWHKVDAHTTWRPGRHGIEEPADGALWCVEDGPALIACPLVGFDRAGNRLGMGMGCYDRWLASHGKHVACLVGLAFSCQELEAIPREAHDIPMDYVVTEQEIIDCQAGG